MGHVLRAGVALMAAMVLAAFLLVLGSYHRRKSARSAPPLARLGAVSACILGLLALALVLAAGYSLAPLPPPTSELQ